MEQFVFSDNVFIFVTKKSITLKKKNENERQKKTNFI